MTSASFAVQSALQSRLVADNAVNDLLGGPRVYDDLPRGASFPYVTFAVTAEKDWSTATEDGSEHIVTLHVWSQAPGRHETDNILAAMHSALHDQQLALAGHRLVNLRQELAEVRRDPDGETFRGLARFRAVTEPL